MKISIVTAVYNRASTIGHALKSVQSQTYDSVEHIVQDGCSTDGTLLEIERFAMPTLSLVTRPDNGIYDALNLGIKRATGDVIGLVHSDDFLAHDQVLAKIASVFSDPNVDGVYSDLQYVSAEDPTRVIRHWRSGDYERTRLGWGWMPPHPTLYLRRQVFEKWGLYDTNLRIAADYDAILRYLVIGEIRLAYIPEVLVKMRLGGESNRSLSRIFRKSREDFIAIRRNRVGGIGTLVMKNVSKIGQFISREGSRTT